MKALIMTILLFSISAFAVENYFPVGKQDAKTVYTKKSNCEQAEGQKCFDITGKNIEYFDVVTEDIDDPQRPIYKSNYNVETCGSPADCASKISNKPSTFCEAGDFPKYIENAVMPGYKLFCQGIAGYSKMNVTHLKENPTKKAAYEANQLALKTETDKAAKLTSDANFGAKLIGMVGLRLREKNLNRVQTKQVMRDYRELLDLLRVGSIQHAKEEVETIVPDGVKISEEDKTVILGAINQYLGN